jgi:SAM-dependent methyltransferase
VLATGFVYRSALVYELVMFLLYGRHYSARYRAVAGLIPEGAEVLDVCCGPATLYHRYLRPKGVRYTGLDLNARFVRRLARGGARGQLWDVRDGRPLPRADYVVMQASLYQFLPGAAAVVGRLCEAARERVLLAEPVRNLADSRVPLLAALARRQTDPGSGAQPHRFTEATLDTLLAPFASRLRGSFLLPGGREKLYLLAPR